MISDGRVLGLPLVNYPGTKAAIEALTLIAANAGATAWATDTEQIGVYDGAAWVWYSQADMLKSVYDTDDDGSVDNADYANTSGDADTVDGEHAAAFEDAGTAAAAVGAHAGLPDVHHAAFTSGDHTAIGDGAPHHAAITLDANADTLLSLSTQEIGLDTQAANRVLAGPASGAAAVPTVRALVGADLPSATEIAQGGAELATSADVKTGTDAGRIVTPAGLAGVIALATPATDGKIIKAGAGVLTLSAAGAYTLTVPATGAAVLRAAGTPLTAGRVPYASDGNTIADESFFRWVTATKTLEIERSVGAQILSLGNHDANGAYISLVSPEINKKDLYIQALHDSSGSPAGALHIIFRVGAAAAPTEAARFTEARSLLIGTTTDGMTTGGSLAIAQDLAHRGSKAGFFNKTPVTQPAVPVYAAIATTETADATYSANEVSMLNNLKTDVTNLRAAIVALTNKFDQTAGSPGMFSGTAS